MANSDTYVTANQLLLVVGIPSIFGIVLILYSLWRLRRRGQKLREAEPQPRPQVFRSLVDPDPPFRELKASELVPDLWVSLTGTGPTMTVMTVKIEPDEVTFEDSRKKITVILARKGDSLFDQDGNEIKVSGRAPYFGNVKSMANIQ